MENKKDIIINDVPKVRKPLTEAQKQVKKEAMRAYYLKKKSDPEYIERQRLSSKTHYYKHKEQVLEKMKKYQQNKLELARIEALHEREPTSPTHCGPGPEPDPLLSYPARTWMSGAGRADKSESDGAGALHAADLGRSRA